VKIIIVGAGIVGTSLAEQLSAEGHDVAVIDADRNRVREINESMEALAIYGDGAMTSTLEKADIRSAEMFVAVTSSDQVNVVAGMIATRLGVPNRVVRIRNPEYAAKDSVLNLNELGIHHVVNSEPMIVNALNHMTQLPGSFDFARLAGGHVEMYGFHIAAGSSAVGRTLEYIRKEESSDAFLVIEINRDGKIMIPGGRETIECGDHIHVLVSAGNLEKVRNIFHPDAHQTQRVVVVGAGRIGLALVQRLEEHIKHVSIIEPDQRLAEDAANELEKTLVLCGSPTDTRLLEEAAVEQCDFFCALSDDDQANMLACLLAKKSGARHTAVLVHHPDYIPVLESLDIDIVLNPRLAVVGEIMRHIRRGHIFSVTRLASSSGELIEMKPVPGCLGVKRPLKELKFPTKAIVGAIVRQGEFLIPTGDTQIKSSDRVFVYGLPETIPTIEKIFYR
jgi:trk system potassium uptake protein